MAFRWLLFQVAPCGFFWCDDKAQIAERDVTSVDQNHAFASIFPPVRSLSADGSRRSAMRKA